MDIPLVGKASTDGLYIPGFRVPDDGAGPRSRQAEPKRPIFAPVVASVRAPSTLSSAVKFPLLTIGTLGAFASAVGNAHQSWSAVYFTDVLRTSPGIAAAGPACAGAAGLPAGMLALAGLALILTAAAHPVLTAARRRAQTATDEFRFHCLIRLITPR